MKVSLFSSESQASCSTSSSLAENSLPIMSHEPASTLFFTMPDSAQPTARDAIVALGTFISTFALLRNYYLGGEERLTAAINTESSATREFINTENTTTRESVEQQGRKTRSFMAEGGEKIIYTIVHEESETRDTMQRAGQEVVHAVNEAVNQSSSDHELIAKMLAELNQKAELILANQKRLESGNNIPAAATIKLLEQLQTASTSERVESSNTTEPAPQPLNTPQNQPLPMPEPQELSDRQSPAANIDSPLPTPEQEPSFTGRLGGYASTIGSFFWRNNQTKA
jgi:ribosome-binding protein aMBF1 (putative translation factor)